MRKLFIIIFFVTVSIGASAQSQSNSTYSIGLKMFALEEQPKLLNEVRNNTKYYSSALNGLMLKINDNQISYRFAAYTFKEKDYTFRNQCSTCEIVSGNYNSLDIKIGFERSIIYSRLQPYYGLELGYKNVEFGGVSADANSKAPIYNVNIEKNGVTLNPFLGLKLNVINAITIGAEAGFDIIRTHDKETKTQLNSTLISNSNFDRWQYASRPLARLSLQFNFGRD
ncbi:hypothetical protein [Pelobium manganitolerans]|uniref:hypothetical protein n=1 Tax=Pelobium manganitolerans TaxID=1842495 RepID=UPI003FA36138